MKAKKLFLLPTLIVVLNLSPAGHLTAQTFTTLHSFTAGEYYSDFWWSYTNSDGIYPNSLILSGNTLYAAAGLGGLGGSGTLFAMNSDGTGFTILHNFAPRHYFGGYVPDTNPDGIYPNSLILSNTTLYGTAEAGGLYGGGDRFAMNIDGTGFTNLHSFPAGSSPGGGAQGFILSGDTLYGTTNAGGSSGNGMVFAVKTNGTGFTVLHSFTATHTNSLGVFTNSDGANPAAGLILSGHTLYGMTPAGGSSGGGTAFAVNTNGNGFANLHSFTYSDGANPFGVLVLSGNTLYGTAERGGFAGNGTVFSLSFAPQLTIATSGVQPGGIVLSWPTNIAGFDYAGFALQASAGLGSTNWTNCASPTVSGGYFVVTNSISIGAQFFRLKK